MTVDLHHEVLGDDGAPPLVLASSLGATGAIFDRQVGALGERLRLVRYDHRGHGRSPVPPGPYALADLGRDVLALLDRLGIERTSFCGVSLGGMVGMWLAAHAPERLDRLVLICTSAHVPGPVWGERAEAVRRAGTVAAIADGVSERWLTPAYAEAHPEVRERLRAMLAGQPPDGYAACCAAIEHMDLRDDLRTVRAPTLVVGGADDHATPPADHAAVIAAGIDGARLEILAPAAHLANIERADAVNRLIAEHVAA